ncbi:MAG TPA: NAD(P)/FAD-dependent oxidoreductase [Tepidisphaeraceae bacterium]|jgi:flavin-dependent dehydrogenase
MSKAEVAGEQQDVYDVLIIGGGPAGALAGLMLARKGRRAVILEKTKFPRFHVGESFLPATLDLIRELGLEEELRKLPLMNKYGAEFGMGHGGSILDINFADGYCDGKETFNIERSIFDAMLLREAGKAGVEVRENTAVKQIVKLSDGDVRVMTDGGDEIRAKYIFDASGQGTVIPKHLGTKKPVEDPKLQKVAYVNHFDGVQRVEGRKAGNPLIAMMDEGWFWVIPINETRTSVGMVLDAAVARQLGKEHNISPDRMLRWGIDKCPLMRERMKDAKGPETNNVVADFSYYCRPFAGEGYFLVGDSAAFLDPIFSTGIFVAGNAAKLATDLVGKLIDGQMAPARARGIYCKQIEQCTGALFKLIRQYYDHSFRELFLEGEGPLSVHRAVIGLLAGNVFPRPPFKLRWRMKLFDGLIAINRKRQLVPRRRRFSVSKVAQVARAS